MELMEDAQAVSAKLRPPTSSTEKVYEIKAGDDQARNLLETVNEINGQLDAARILRKQKEGILSTVEKELIDKTFESTERALREVAKLVEPCQVPMKSNKGNMAFGTRLMYVLRESPRVLASSTQLGIASQRLQTALQILCRQVTTNLPPSYEESQFLTQRRAQNMFRKAGNPPASQQRTRSGSAASTVQDVAEDGDELGDLMHFTANTSSPKIHYDELFFDSVEVQTKHASWTGPYVPYRPPDVSDGFPATAVRVPRPASVPEVKISPPSELGSSLAQGISLLSPRTIASGEHISPRAHSMVPRTSTALQATQIKHSIRPPVRPKPDALRSLPVSTENSAPTYSTARSATDNSQKRRDWEMLPSQLPRTSQDSTFVFISTSLDLTLGPFFQNMVKLDKDESAPEDIARVQIDLPLNRTQGRHPTQPLLESEFPEAVSELSLSSEPVKPDYEGLGWGPQEGVEPVMLVTEVSSDMMARSKSRREARLLDQASNAPEVVPRRQSMHAPELSIRQRASAPAASPSERRLSDTSVSSSQSNPPRGDAVASSSQPSLSGRARSQRWRELQFERSQLLDKGKWFS